MGAEPPPRGVGLNFAVLMLSEVVGQLVLFLMGTYMARALGPDAFGVWVFASSVVGFLVMGVDAGTEAWGVREVSARPARLGGIVLSVVTLRLGIAALLTPALLGIAFALALPPDRRWALAFGATSLLAFALQTGWALRGIERVVPVAASTLLQRVAMLGLTVALLRSPDQVAYITLWQGLSELAGALLCLGLTARWIRRAPAAPQPANVRRVLGEAWPLGASRLLRAFMFTATVAILAHSWPDAAVGEYGAAQRLAVPILTLTNIFGFAVFPTVARACFARGAEERGVLLASLRLLATLLVPLAVGGAVLAAPLIRLVFTERYAAAAGPLRLLLLALVLAGISDHLRRVLQARRQQALVLRLVAVAVAVSLGLGLAVVPVAGAPGSAGAFLVGELVLLVLAARGVRRTGPAVPIVAALARPALAAAVMAGGLLLLPDLPPAASASVGMLIYAAVLLLLRGNVLADLRQLEAGGPRRVELGGAGTARCEA